MSNKKIKIISSDEKLNLIDFKKNLHQIYWILNSIIEGDKAQLFGNKKYVGWCNMSKQVQKYKLVLYTLEENYDKLINQK